MDGRKNTQEGAGDYIWLRYSTSITIAGRPRTIEIGIPMPIGADEEEREQLLREADAGMNQLTGHVENRIAQMLQRVQPTQGNIPAPTPTAKPSVNPPPRAVSRPASAPVQPQQVTPQQPVPAANDTNSHAVAQPQQASQPLREERETRAEQVSVSAPEEMTPQTQAPTTRPTMGVSMPTTGDSSGNLSIPQFIRVVKDRFDLNPTQAMEMLKLKSLSGVNLREKLEVLQRMQGQDANSNGQAEKNNGDDATNGVVGEKSSKPERQSETPASKPPTVKTPSKPLISTRLNTPDTSGAARTQTPQSPTGGNVRDGRATYFDEEEEFEDILAEIDEDNELEATEQPRELTPQERLYAKDLVSKFRESQGAALANPARLRVLSNVTDGQVSEEEIQDLIQGIWSMSSVKKLKVDQVESLISWAKEDDFMTDVEIVLLLLEEEALARGNR